MPEITQFVKKNNSLIFSLHCCTYNGLVLAVTIRSDQCYISTFSVNCVVFFVTCGQGWYHMITAGLVKQQILLKKFSCSLCTDSIFSDFFTFDFQFEFFSLIYCCFDLLSFCVFICVLRFFLEEYELFKCYVYFLCMHVFIHLFNIW